jgi:heat-inducible transcriptional repressor
MAAHKSMLGLRPEGAAPLDERARRVLSAIVRDYIQAGEPVGSHAIARRPDVDVSSATVRAVMADLEELGFLDKPHTSAGRIPTAAGYRYYVDALLRLKQPLPEEREQIERRAQEAGPQVDSMMASASRVLHLLTRHAGVVAAPRPQAERLQRVEFVPLREGRALAVLVSRSGAVRNRVLQLPRIFSLSELEQTANYLNSLIENLTLAEALTRVREEQAREKAELGALREQALMLGAQAVGTQTDSVHIEGEASLFDDKIIAQDLVKIRALVQALEKKELLVSVLDRTLAAQELQIFIGAESGIVEPDLAIVAAPYRLRGEIVGALGVIGPTRMDYSRVAPLVELTAKMVGLALGEN